MERTRIKKSILLLNKAKNIRIHSIKYKNKKKNKIIKKKCIYLIGKIIIIFSFFFFFTKYLIFYRNNEKNLFDYNSILWNKTIEKDINKEYEDILNFRELVMNGTELYKNKIYYPSKNPKISIIFSVYNGEPYLKTTLLSIQNQDFKDIEIVMIDDCSQDNSVNLIKELMKTEPRIVLYENKENKGALYSKSKGVMLSRGKYVMTLDEDDIYVQKDAFSSLYVEAEKNNLDILGFIPGILEEIKSGRRPNYSDKFRIIYQPELSNLFYSIDSFGKVHKFGGNLWNHFIRADLFKKAIKKIDEKNMNIKTNRHDDFILFFLMTRIAKSIKYVNRIFYLYYPIWVENDKIKFRYKIKREDEFNIRCLSFLNFLEMFFKNTKNTLDDKKIAFWQLESLYFNNECRNNKVITKRAIEVCKLFLDNEFVSEEGKNKIKNFINSNPI